MGRRCFYSGAGVLLTVFAVTRARCAGAEAEGRVWVCLMDSIVYRYVCVIRVLSRMTERYCSISVSFASSLVPQPKFVSQSSGLSFSDATRVCPSVATRNNSSGSSLG